MQDVIRLRADEIILNLEWARSLMTSVLIREEKNRFEIHRHRDTERKIAMRRRRQRLE